MKAKVATRVSEDVKARAKVAEMTLIDDYGRIDEEIKRLTKIKEGLREKILSQLGEGTHSGNEYELSITTTQSITLDPIQVAKTIGAKDALRIASISVEKARAIMSPADIEKCISEVKTGMKIIPRKKNA